MLLILTDLLYTQNTLQGALMLKTPPASAGDMRHRVQSLGWDDVLEEGMEAHSSFLAGEISVVGTWRAIIHRVAKNPT